MPRKNKPTFPFPEDTDFISIPSDAIIHAVESKSAPPIDSKNPMVRRLNSKTLVKSSRGMLPSEASAMKLVAARTDIRVPEIYRFISREGEMSRFGTKGYLVMGHLPGQTLATLWPGYNKVQKERAVAKIWDAVLKLREVKIGEPGPIGGGMAQGGLFTQYGAGPFPSAQTLEEWYSHKLEVCKRFKRVPNDAPSFEGRFEPPFCMTHQDLALRNMLIDDEGELALVDWAFAGAYPPWFEIYAFGILDFNNPADYKKMMREMMSREYEEETKHLRLVHYALFTAPFA
ncbi:hypothetical protein TWF481_005915 [Arthrobotrys musiformis]|uniref:Protein kinase domain-containing protein n=1 Tax=Arthrobotrys musiformis TaxID=47236 RepID=A0AAV9WF51_9PEZI